MSAEEFEGYDYEAEASGGGLFEVFADPIGVVQRRRLAMLAAVILGLVLTAVTCAAWKPLYVAQTTVLITSKQIPEDFVRSTVQEDTLANVNAMIGNALSAEKLTALIERLNLFPELKNAQPVEMVAMIRERIVAEPATRADRGSNAQVFSISYSDENRHTAAEVSNAVATLFVEESIRHRHSQATRTLEFLRGELARDEAALREQTRLVSEFRREHRGQLPDELPTTLGRIQMLNTRRESLTQQISATEDRIVTLAAGGSAATEDEALLAELRRQLAQQSAIHTDEHPNVVALRDRISRLRASGGSSSVEGPTGRMIESERRNIERLHEEIARVDAEVAELNLRVDGTPRVAEELTALENKQQVLSDDYVVSARKVEEAGLAESLESAEQGAHVSVLDAAQPPASPKNPRWLVALAGIVFSVGLAAGAAVLLELIDPVIINARQVEQLGARPVIGALPKVAA